MTRINLTDLAAVQPLTEREQADVHGGLSWAAVLGLAAAGAGGVALATYLYNRVQFQGINGINGRIKQLFRMAPQVNRTRRSNCQFRPLTGKWYCYS